MRVAYHTFGCKANQYDTERMRQELEARGALTVGVADADLVVVNTCTVTNHADAEARKFLRRLRREHPGIRLVVAGCSSALDPDVYQEMDGVEGVVQGHDPVQVAHAVAPPTRLVQLGVPPSLAELDMEPVGGRILMQREGATRGWLKVQDGCDRKCAFCATRLARGASRSRSPDEVVREALALAQVHPELVVTGIHIGHYGVDLDPPITLSRLVARLLDEVPEVRFRLGSIEATEIDDLLLDLLVTSGGRLAPHLHMPLQSGADAVLANMRRWHTRETYRSRTLEIAARIPLLGLGADVITGFPGESADDHAETRALIEELPYTYLHVFPFSPRNGTVAVDLPHPVPQRIAGERSRELRAIVSQNGRAYRMSRSEQSARVVLEGTGGFALTEDYLRVRVEGDLPVQIDRVHDGRLRWDGDDLYIRLATASGLVESHSDMDRPGLIRDTSGV